MSDNKIEVITNTKRSLRCISESTKKQYHIPEDTVVNGYLKKSHVVIDILNYHCRQYGIKRYTLTFVIYSTENFRWLCSVPKGTPKEVEKMLRHHKQELLPIEVDNYFLSYRAIACKEDTHFSQVGVVGIPQRIREGYERLGHALGCRHITVIAEEDIFSLSFKQMSTHRCVVVYKKENKLYGLLLEDYFCFRTHLLYDGDKCNKDTLHFFTKGLLELIHFQNKASENKLHLYMMADTIEFTSAIGIERYDSYFQEILSCSYSIQQNDVGNAYSYVNSLPFKTLKAKSIFDVYAKYSASFLCLGSIGMSMTMIFFYLVQLVYYGYQDEYLTKQLQQPLYIPAMKEIAHEKREEERLLLLEDCLNTIEESKVKVKDILDVWHIVYAYMEPFRASYTIESISGALIIEGESKGVTDVIDTVKHLEVVLDAHDILCHFDGNNSFEGIKFRITIEERSVVDE